MTEQIPDDVIEEAAKALFAVEEPDRNSWRWDRENPHTPDDPLGWHDYWRDAAREAATPVARWARKQALPDRESLTRAIRDVTDSWDEPLDEVHDVPQIVNAVLALLAETEEEK